MTAIFVSVKPEETRMGLVFDSKLRDFAVERRGEGNLVGNIFTEAVYRMLCLASRLPLSILMWGKMGS